MGKDYSLLSSSKLPDEEKLKQYADLVNEVAMKRAALRKLEAMMEEHEEELSPFLWGANNRATSIFELESDHILNILNGNFAKSDTTRTALEEIAVKRELSFVGATMILDGGFDEDDDEYLNW